MSIFAYIMQKLVRSAKLFVLLLCAQEIRALIKIQLSSSLEKFVLNNLLGKCTERQKLHALFALLEGRERTYFSSTPTRKRKAHKQRKNDKKS
jgi:hypothetical protein